MEKGKDKVDPILNEEERWWLKALDDFDIISEQVFPYLSLPLNFLGPSSLCIEFCYVYLHLNQASLLAVFYLSYIMFAGVISLMDICTMFMPFELDSLWLNSLCYNYGQI